MASGRSEKYDINETEIVGYAIIFVNKFEHSVKLEPRCGAEDETKMLKEMFTKLGFQTIIFGEVTKEKFLEIMREIRSDEELKKHSMIALAICSHGVFNNIMFPTQNMISPGSGKDQAEGGHTMLPVKEIQDSVMSEYLQGKPKLIILNACREKTDAQEKLCEGDRFTIFSTKAGLETTKFEFEDTQVFIPMFLIKLYESLDDHKPDEDIITVTDRINYLFTQTKEMKERPKEQCEIEKDVGHKRLYLRVRSRFKKLNVLLTEQHEYGKDSAEASGTICQKKLSIYDVQCATSIAYYKRKKCYYLCDPLTSRVTEFSDDFKNISQCYFDNSLASPRYIVCFSIEDCIFVSHEQGVSRVNMRDGKQTPESLDIAKEYISPCLAANENEGILFILNRFSTGENNSRQIIVYDVVNNERFENSSENIQLSPQMIENYNPIIVDMNFRKYPNGQKQLLILVYLPSPHLLIFTISDKHPIKLNHLSKHLLPNCEPCFLASYENYTLFSCPNSQNSIIKKNDEDSGEVESYKKLEIQNTQGFLIHENGDAVITAIEGNKCVIYYWKAITYY